MIKKEIDEFVKFQTQYTSKDLEFLEEIAELVIRARRALTYTYPMRYYLENNPAKKAYFDFIQGDLEFSLEKLVQMYERDWKDYIEPETFSGTQKEETNIINQVTTHKQQQKTSLKRLHHQMNQPDRFAFQPPL